MKSKRATPIIGYDEDGVPIIQAIKSGINELTFYCQYCKRIHYHSGSAGHRVAHCWQSPFSKKGYILKVVLNEPY